MVLILGFGERRQTGLGPVGGSFPMAFAIDCENREASAFPLRPLEAGLLASLLLRRGIP
jgi:hypothetical protein